MSQTNRSITIATGLAMFSMFFGAGNVVFPLALGQIAQDQNFFAILGMLITAVGVPFMGLTAMTLFDGNYERFFARIGKTPGFLVALIIMGLIGSFGAIPRCIALSFSTAKTFLPDISLAMFSAISCVIIWLFTVKRNSIIDTLGYVLTPLLIGSLAVIIIKGLFMTDMDKEAISSSHHQLAIFLTGLKDGYQTMDLLGAFFFSSVIIGCLKTQHHKETAGHKQLIITTLKASAIGASLLALTYIGFSYVAAFHSGALMNIPSDELISMVSIHVLGSNAAIIACITVALACLTTAIALSSVFAEFIHKDITNNKLSYQYSLIITLLISFFISTLNFNGIAAILAPILQVCYPSLITLCIFNILHKIYHIQIVKTPVLIVFLLSVGIYFWG